MVVDKEHLISKISRGDAIMVDKGFLTDKKCSQKGYTNDSTTIFKKEKTEENQV
jgi:hypothetical protein